MTRHINELRRKPGERCPICGDSSCSVPQEIKQNPLMPMSPMALIRGIPHSDQRYDTCGDWYYQEVLGSTVLCINVSRLADRREMFLVAIHELVEAFLCECAGVTEAEVDQFDYGHAQMALKGEEPGDCITAPYYKQHQIATGIERILAAEAGVSWLEYEKHVEELSR